MIKNKNRIILLTLLLVIGSLFLSGPIYTADSGEVGSITAETPNAAPGVADEQKIIISKPQPRIQIPGLKLSDVNDIQVTEGVDNSGKKTFSMSLPFLGEYLAAIYRYVVAISSIVAVAMIMLEGFKLITSRGNSEEVSGAKKRIGAIFIGLILIFTSYLFLSYLNPNLLQFKNLEIKYVPEGLITPWTKENEEGLNLSTGNKYCGCLKFRQLYSTSKLISAELINNKIKTLKSNSPLVGFGNIILADAQKYRLDPMLALSIWHVDSGLATAGAGATNRNPGNIICGGTTPGENYTCDSSSHHFRVYKNYEDAIHDWFASTDINTGWKMWKNSTNIKELINYYAPPSDNNKTNSYIDLVTTALIQENKATLNDLNNGICSC